METYKDINGDSGVSAYEIGNDYIKVKFKHGNDIYLYTYARPGAEHVERMKELAKSGDGLNAYININVRDKYESKS